MTPEFGLHVNSSRSTPSGASSLPISSPEPQFPVKLSIRQRFPLCLIHQRISVPQLCFSSHLLQPARSTHHPRRAVAHLVHDRPKEYRPKTGETHHHLFSGNRGSEQSRSEFDALTGQKPQKNEPDPANSFVGSPLTSSRLH